MSEPSHTFHALAFAENFSLKELAGRYPEARRTYHQLRFPAASGGTVYLFASGTISGFEPGTEGSLLESGRGFLADGDTVVLRGRAGTIELGDVGGTIVS